MIAILSIYTPAAHIGHRIDRLFIIYNAFNLYYVQMLCHLLQYFTAVTMDFCCLRFSHQGPYFMYIPESLFCFCLILK